MARFFSGNDDFVAFVCQKVQYLEPEKVSRLIRKYRKIKTKL